MKKIAPSAELRSRAWSAMSATWTTVLSVTCAISLFSYVVNAIVGEIPGIGGLLSLVVALLCAVPTTGLVCGMLGYLRGRPITFDCIQSMFPHWKQVILFILWMMLCLMGWLAAGLAAAVVGGLLGAVVDGSGVVSAVLYIIGVIAALVLMIRAVLNYSVVQCILADDPNVGARNALRRSKEMMRGYRWHYVKVQFPVYIVMLVIGMITGLLYNVLPSLLVMLISTVLSIAPNVMMRYFVPVMYEELCRIRR